MQFLPKQKEFLSDFKTPVLAYVGGFGSGKTYSTVHKALAFCVMNPSTAGMLVSPTFSMLRDTTRRTFIEVLEEKNISFLFKATENRIILTDVGSEVWFRSGDDPNKLKGSNLAWVGMDEAAQMEKEVYQIALSRIRDPKAKVRQLFITTTPEGFNWLYDEFKEHQTNKRIIISKTTENTFLPESYIESLYQNYDELLVKQYINGEFVNINQGRVYYSFSRAENVKPVTFRNGLDIYLTFDFNVNPMTTSFAQIVSGSAGEQEKIINVFHSLNIRNGNTDLQCKEIKRVLADYNFQGKLHITGDASHPKSTTSNRTDWEIIEDHFPTADFIRRKSNPAIQDRVNHVNAKLKNSKGLIGIYIDPKCAELVQDFEQVSWKEGTREIDKSNPKLTHNSDNLGYLVFNLFPISGVQETTIKPYR